MQTQTQYKPAVRTMVLSVLVIAFAVVRSTQALSPAPASAPAIAGAKIITSSKTVAALPAAKKTPAVVTVVEPSTQALVTSSDSSGIRAQRLLARLVKSFGSAQNGQVLTFLNGKISWQDGLHAATSIDDLMHQPAAGRKPKSFVGDERHYAGGGGQTSGGTSTTTSITNITTGLTQGEADDLYVNVTGDTMVGGLNISYNGLGLTLSGSSIFDANARFNSTVTVNGVTYNFPAADGIGSGKVLKSNGAGQLSWSNDDAVGTGLSQASGDQRYVRKSGDTMTGALTINLTTGYLGLKVINTMSGNIIHAEKDLTSSGTILANGNITTRGTFSGKTLQIWGTGNSTFSGSVIIESLLSGSTIQGFNLGSCNGASQKLLYDPATKKFTCGTDLNTGSAIPFGTGNVLTIGDSRYVRTSGGTMTGTLVIANGKSLQVAGTISGTTLKILGTASGNIIHAEKSLSSSGTLTWEGAASGATLYVATSINGAGLTDCDAASQVLKWDATSGRFSCSTLTSNTFGTGNVLTIADSRYVNQSGDTMTGTLVISNGKNLQVAGTISGTTLKILGTASGNIIHAEKTLTSSGTLTWEGAASGASLYVATSINGAGLTDCDVAGSSKLLWDSTTGRFSCGTDQSGSSGISQSVADERYVRKAGDTMTGALIINLTTGSLGLRVMNTMSGNIIHAEKNLTSSGTILANGNITSRGTFSGKTLQIWGTGNSTFSGSVIIESLLSGSTIQGFNLGSCNGSSQKLLYDPATKKFTCGTDLNTGSAPPSVNTGGVLQLGDQRYLRTSGGTMTGQLVINLTTGFYGLKLVNTMSGNIIHAEKDLTSSGTLTVVGTGRFKNGLTVLGTLTGNIIHAEKTLTSSGTLTWEGAASGATLYVATSVNGAGLTDCDASTQTLRWDSTTGRFSCGTATNNNFGTGNVLTIGDARYLKRSGGTMTGQLVVNITNGDINTIGLKVLNTLSGAQVHAEKLLTSSGRLIVTGSGVFKSSSATTRPLVVIGSTSQTADLQQWQDSTMTSLLNITSAGRVQFPVKGSGRISELYTDSSDNLFLTAGLGLSKTITIGSGAVTLTLSSTNLVSAVPFIALSRAVGTYALTARGVSGQTGDLQQWQTFSGSPLSIVNASGALALGTPYAGSKLAVSGAVIINGVGNANYSFKADDGVALEVIGTISGTSLKIGGTGNSTFSGSVIIESGLSGSTIEGFNLRDCQGTTNKLTYNAATKKFLCESDQSGAGGGLTYPQASGIFVNQSGDTMTGTLVIANGKNLQVAGTISGTTLKILGTASGNIIHAEKDLTSSGTILANGNITSRGTFSGKTLQIWGTGNSTFSGSVIIESLLSGSTIQGFNLGSCNGSSQKLLYDPTTKKFTCGTDLNTGSAPPSVNTGGVLQLGDQRYLRTSGGTMTGQLVINLTTGFYGLKLVNTMSGNIIHAEKNLTSSGTILANGNITSRGTFSGKTLQIWGNGNSTFSGSVIVESLLSGSTIQGFNLGSCNASTQKLLYDPATKKFTCGTDNNAGTFGTGNVITIGDNRYLRTSGGTMTGQLVVNLTTGFYGLKLVNTMSGNIIHAEKDLTSSGTILANGNITSRGTFSGKTLQIWGNGNSTFSGSVIIESLLSGSTIQGFNLGSCNASTQKLLYDPATKKFTCGTDNNVGTFGTGNVLTIGDNRYLRTSGGTMTGQLVINLTTGFYGLKLVNTMSGNIIHAEKNLTSSGTILANGNITSRGTFSGKTLQIWGNGNSTFSGSVIIESLLSGSTIQGFGLGSCNAAGQKVLYNTSTKQFTCGTDLTTGSSPPSVNTGGVLQIGDQRYLRTSGGTMTGQLVINLTTGFYGLKLVNTMSGNIIHAEKNLTSSGFILSNGNITTRGTFSGSALKIWGTGNSTFSGSVIIESLLSGSTIQGFNLRDCQGTSNKLTYNVSTKKFLCETDQTSAGAGITQSDGDARYVNTSGDTMTGALRITATGTSLSLTGGILFQSSYGKPKLGSGISISLDSFGGISEIVVQGRYAYVATDTSNGLPNILVIDVANPDAPKVLSTVNDNGVRGLAVAGRYLYACMGTNLKIYDISTPTVIRPMSTLAIGGSACNFHGLRVSGKYAYAGSFAGFSIIDISNPMAPFVIAKNGSRVDGVAIQSRYAYVGVATYGLYAQDITKLNNFADFPTGGNTGHLYTDITVDGNYAYYLDNLMLGNNTAVFRIADISNPNNITDVGSFSVADCISCTISSLAVAGRYAYITTHSTGGDPNVHYFMVLDISDPTHPYQVSYSDVDGSALGAVAVSGENAYVGVQWGTDPNIDFRILKLPGIDAPTANIGAVTTALLQVSQKAVIAGDMLVGGGLSVGSSGISSQGPLSITLGSGSTNITGAIIRTLATSNTNNAPLLALDNYSNSYKAPAIRFGYRGNNEISLYRSQTGTLALSGSMVIGNNLSVKLLGGGSSSTTLCASSTGTLALCSSALRFKENVQNLGLGLATVRKMRPVTFQWKADGTPDFGYIAEEMEAVDPSLVFYYNGQIQGVKYMQLTAVLTNALKALDFRTLGLTNNSGSLTLNLTNPSGSGVTINSTTTSGAATLFKITSNVGGTGNTVLRVNASGAVFSDSTFNSQGADYAEWFATADSTLTQGELVCIDILSSNTVRKCDRAADPNLMGIVSTNPAFIGNAIHGADTESTLRNHVLVGLIGQVPAKVSLEAGPIRPGDALTASSIPGFARRAVAGESTVGVALEGFDGSKPNARINVLISRRNQSLTVEAVEQHITESIAQMKLQDEIALMLQNSLQNLANSPDLLAVITTQIQSLDLSQAIDAAFLRHFSGSTLQTTQTLDSATLQMITNMNTTLTVLSSYFTGSTLHAATMKTTDISIAGTLTLQGNITSENFSLSGSHVQIGSLMQTGSLALLGKLTISELATFLGDVRINGELILSSKQAGFAVIPASVSSVTVKFTTPMTGVPVINLTPQTRVGTEWWIDTPTATGFTIRTAAPVTQNTKFSWTALAADAPLTYTGALTASSLIPFPVNFHNQPFSLTDPVWTACVQGRQILDSTGNPYNCSRYHDGFVWEHPDLHIAFTFNPNAEPPLLVLPEGYEAVQMDDGTGSSSSSSSTSSSESSSSSSSMSSSESSSSSSSFSSSESSSSSSSDSSESSSSSSSDSSESSSSSSSSSEG